MDERGETLVGVLGDDGDVCDAVEAAGLQAVTGDPAAVLAREPGVVLAVGESSLLSLARATPSVPVLPVEAGHGVRSVPESRVGSALDRVAAGDWTTDRHPLVEVAFPDGRALALMDAMLVTATPADISEYTVTADGERVATFRADGVVFATPAGTTGYARAAGVPVLPPGSDSVAVLPIAPFATTLDHWVVPLETVTVTVERDEAPVEVLADDRTVATLSVDQTVEFGLAGHVDSVRVPEGTSPFDRYDDRLEKL